MSEMEGIEKAPWVIKSEDDWVKPAHRNRFHALLIMGIMMTLAAVLFLFSPRPEKNYDQQYFSLNQYIGFPINCDAYSYIRPAQFPNELLMPHETRQIRPLFVGSAALLGRVLDGVIQFTGIENLPFYEHIKAKAAKNTADKWIQFGKNQTLNVEERKAQYEHIVRESEGAIPFYGAYILINFILLFASLTLFYNILHSAGVRKEVILFLAPMLVFNDIVKPYIWNVQSAMFIIFAPTLLVYFLQRILILKSSFRQRLAYSAIGGTFLCAYPSFLLFFPALAVLNFMTQYSERLGYKTLFSQTFGLGAVFIAPLATWLFVVYSMNHSVYLLEASGYHMFVWLLDIFKVGLWPFCLEVLNNTLLFLKTFNHETLPWIGMCLVFAFYLRRNGNKKENEQMIIADNRKPVLISIVLLTLFYWILGNYETRLTFTLLPPLLALAGIQIEQLLRKHPSKRLTGISILSALLVCIWVGIHVVKYGPFE